MSKLGHDFKPLVAFRVSDFFFLIMDLTNLIIVFCY